MTGDTDDHGHDHGGGPVLTYADDSVHDRNETGHFELLTDALKELSIEKGLVTATEVREYVEFFDSRGTEKGAEIIAKAWTDPAYKERLLADGTAAAAELDIPMAGAELVAVENTDSVHNVIVCTLCSCYPRTILGLPPDWYKSKSYRSRTVNEPRSVLKEFGTELPDGVALRVHDSNADMRYLVLPKRPAGTEDWPEERLRELVTRDSMIGVAPARDPA